jgi:lipid A 3-O-deacylase
MNALIELQGVLRGFPGGRAGAKHRVILARVVRNLLLLFVLLFLGGLSEALAQEALAQEARPWRFRQFQVENDVFPVPYTHPGDRFYTSGVRVSFGNGAIVPEADRSELPFWLRPVRKACPGCRIYPNFSVGQQMYTPEDIENPDPQPGERPWAAWLYAGFGAAVDSSASTRHDIEVQIGVTGDAAGGRFGQRVWHELIDEEEPRGWDNQLGPDLGINGYYDFQHIWRESGDESRLDWDLVPSVKAAVGTMMTYAGVGGTFRVGRNISDFPYSPIRPSERRTSSGRVPNLEVYGFIGADVRAVAYNYFLEGGLFRDEPVTVDPQRYVWDFKFGVTARFDRYNITYAIVRRSEEFERTVGTDRGIHNYASLSLTVGIP